MLKNTSPKRFTGTRLVVIKSQNSKPRTLNGELLPGIQSINKAKSLSPPHISSNLSRNVSVPSDLYSALDNSRSLLRRGMSSSKIETKSRVLQSIEKTKAKKIEYRRRTVQPEESSLSKSQSPSKTLSNSVSNASIKFNRILKNRVPRVVDKLSWRTKTGLINGHPKRINQDAYMIVTDFSGVKNQLLIGVMDGHGTYGHEASSFVRKNLPLQLAKEAPYLAKAASELDLDDIVELENAFKKGHAIVNSQLRTEIDVMYSGTTSVTCLVRDKDLICANTGDSRAILGRCVGDSWEACALSKDHKPDDIYERARILKHGGRIEPMYDEAGNPCGPARVWLSTENVPGLAMSRSFGDIVASCVGVIATPDVRVTRLTPDDKFVLVASDGIFEYMTNQACVDIIAQYWSNKKTENACEALVDRASKMWVAEGPVVDDITVVLAFFKA